MDFVERHDEQEPALTDPFGEAEAHLQSEEQEAERKGSPRRRRASSGDHGAVNRETVRLRQEMLDARQEVKREVTELKSENTALRQQVAALQELAPREEVGAAGPGGQRARGRAVHLTWHGATSTASVASPRPRRTRCTSPPPERDWQGHRTR
eukprot:TRINITY_DN18810_c0_g1_i2.p1 TRINITY_DN18810_c0_g1~~TRINITY_DN18810_c0_g1_i2.p1  ORF type:complete len:153 (-),score=14.09 TRINITY_DN18810_c0_g1_i2:32-490(-)